MIILHLQHLPPSPRSPHAHPPVPRIPPSANLPQQLPGTAGGSPEPPGSRVGAPVPGLHPSSSVLARGDPESLPRTCVGLRGDAPAAPVPTAARPPRRARDASPRAARGGSLSLGVARPRHLRQPGRACSGGGRGTASGPRAPPGPHGERELGNPARLRRQVGRAGWGSRRWDRPCAPPSPASRRAGGRRAVASARTADPGARRRR